MAIDLEMELYDGIAHALAGIDEADKKVCELVTENVMRTIKAFEDRKTKCQKKK